MRSLHNNKNPCTYVLIYTYFLFGNMYNGSWEAIAGARAGKRKGEEKVRISDRGKLRCCWRGRPESHLTSGVSSFIKIYLVVNSSLYCTPFQTPAKLRVQFATSSELLNISESSHGQNSCCSEKYNNKTSYNKIVKNSTKTNGQFTPSKKYTGEAFFSKIKTKFLFPFNQTETHR